MILLCDLFLTFVVIGLTFIVWSFHILKIFTPNPKQSCFLILFFIFTAILQFIYWLGFSDVGMMMMQSGMVKQSVDFTSSIKAFDGTKIDKHKTNAFYENCFVSYEVLLYLSRPLSTYFLIQSQPKTLKNILQITKSNAQCVLC